MIPGAHRIFVAGLAFAAAVHGQEPPAFSAEQVAYFEERVEPIFAEHCVKCHGGGDSVKGGLYLTSRAGLLTGGDLGPAVDVANPEASLLLAMLSYKDEHHQMPPSGKLPDEQIAAIREWIVLGMPWTPGAEGAAPIERREAVVTDEDRAHWAFRPVARPEVPEVTDAAWAENPIDAFVFAKLAENGLTSAPPASPEALIRRVYYDVTGLPPSPEEVKAFAADPSPEAYGQLVEHLLASPHYGEKWGRHWLDVVRYADSNGYERDSDKPHMWRYRDYVIDAFNADKPYDRFVIEQIAGDELPGADGETITATGFYRLGVWDDEPADKELGKYDVFDNILDTIGQGFLGLTVGCARCHDHKIDPFPAKDYYRMLAFVHNVTNMSTDAVARSILTPYEQRVYDQKVAEQQGKVDTIQAWMFSFQERFRLKLAESEPGALEGVPASDMADLKYRFYRDTWTTLPDFDVLRPESAGDAPGNVFSLAPATRNEAIGFVFEGRIRAPQTGKYTFHISTREGSRLLIDGAVIADGPALGIHNANPEIELTEGFHAIRLDYFNSNTAPYMMIHWSGPGFEKRPLTGDGNRIAGKLNELLDKRGEEILGPEAMAEYRSQRDALDAAKKAKVPGRFATAVAEYGSEAPDTFVLIRGNPHVQGPQVEPRFPEVLTASAPALPEPASGAPTTGRRLVLAEWMASAENPLTARVMVNRIWQYHFGRGIVRSSNNFGVMGDAPTHPELLDWLAAEFVARGWRMKEMHRLILHSRAYRMASQGSAEALAKDPQNNLLWRFDMRRLGAEEVRDTILAASGTINLKTGGPGVYPRMPEEALKTSSMASAMWFESPEEEWTRRSVYIHVKRSLLTPLLQDFDLADTDATCPVRFATTQPGQALSLLNSDFAHEQAAAFAERLRREAGSDPAAQVRRGLSIVTCREPSADEVARGLRFLDELTGDLGVPPDRALQRFCLMALNLNEFIFLD